MLTDFAACLNRNATVTIQIFSVSLTKKAHELKMEKKKADALTYQLLPRSIAKVNKAPTQSQFPSTFNKRRDFEKQHFWWNIKISLCAYTHSRIFFFKFFFSWWHYLIYVYIIRICIIYSRNSSNLRHTLTLGNMHRGGLTSMLTGDKLYTSIVKIITVLWLEG